MVDRRLDEFLEYARELAEKAVLVERVEEALRQGYVETPRPHGSPHPPQYTERLVVMQADIVKERWLRDGKPTTLKEAYKVLVERIKECKRLGLWPQEWKIPSKRTADRCMNWSADPRFPLWRSLNPQDPKPATICLKPGTYLPNPALFDPQTKRRLQELLTQYQGR